jgi:hypothetical protein
MRIAQKQRSSLRMREDLVAPCGMNSGPCSGYIAYCRGIPKKRGVIGHCRGCRPRQKRAQTDCLHAARSGNR